MEQRINDLRKRLIALLALEPNTIKKVSVDIGINYQTLTHFIYGTKQTKFMRLSIIENYILRKEAAHRLNNQ